MSDRTEAVVAVDGLGWEQIDLYRFFAFVFSSPSPERFDWLSGAALPAALARLWDALGCGGELPGVSRFDGYAKYESSYISLFDVGIPEPPVPLFESAHSKSRPAQQIALENASFYEVLGLRAEPGRGAPDYLVTQLEFLSAVRFARENNAAPENRESLARIERDFLERHLLSWLPAAQRKLDRLQPPVFPVLLKLLLAFLKQQRASLAAR